MSPYTVTVFDGAGAMIGAQKCARTQRDHEIDFFEWRREVCGTACLLLATFLSTVAGSARAGTISGSYSNLPLGTVVDLTAAGPADWVHWGLFTDSSINRKALVPPQISDYTLLI